MVSWARVDSHLKREVGEESVTWPLCINSSIQDTKASKGKSRSRSGCKYISIKIEEGLARDNSARIGREHPSEQM